jgi:putative SOS response-associated peptidase YedK
MCNAYDIGGQTGGFSDLVKTQGTRALEPFVSRCLIRRTDQAPVLLEGGDVVLMSWGFRRSGLGVINNSRSDKLQGPMWKEPFEKSRCLVPVTAYYEWTGSKGNKTTHRFTSPNGETLWMAGLWENSPDVGLCFSMITTEANATVTPIHHRMPALLESDEQEPYLAGEMSFFAPLPSSLQVTVSANPLLKNPPTEIQGDLFS